MIQSSRLQQRKLQHGKEMVIAVKKSSKKVILAVVIRNIGAGCLAFRQDQVVYAR